MNLKYVKCVVFVGIAVIIILQAFWINSLYQKEKEKLNNASENLLQKAIDFEFLIRENTLDKFFSIAYKPEPLNNDTSTLITSNLVTEDTTIVIRYNKNDPYADQKIRQLIIYKEKPLCIQLLDSLFKDLLIKEGFPIHQTYIDLIDISSQHILNSNKPTHLDSKCLITETVTIDINNSWGVKGYIEKPEYVLLERMTLQLILSAVFFLLITLCFFYLNKTIAQQRKAEKIRKDFVDTMTHEFKRPISSAIASVDLILSLWDNENFKPEQRKDKLKTTIQDLMKLNLYTQKIQEISKNGQDNIFLDKEKIEVKSFFQSIQKKYIATEISEDGKITEVNLNMEDVQQMYLRINYLHFSNVMDNLIENAIKYSGNPVKIDLTIREDSKNWIISVKDNGFGIDRIDQNHIFDKFYRSNTKRYQNIPGFGLGLTYVKSIVESHKGKVSCKSKINEGSIFTIIIPQ